MQAFDDVKEVDKENKIDEINNDHQLEYYLDFITFGEEQKIITSREISTSIVKADKKLIDLELNSRHNVRY